VLKGRLQRPFEGANSEYGVDSDERCGPLTGGERVAPLLAREG
jgi:hypothetical protein